MTEQSTVEQAARAWLAAGVSVVPARTDGSKAPAAFWKRWTTQLPTTSDLYDWFHAGHPGLGLVCGAVSGGLEMLELEGRAVQDGVLERLIGMVAAAGLSDLWQRLTGEGYCEATPSGGIHLLYRLDGMAVPGNTKLARRPATTAELEQDPQDRIKTLIETRGEGGYVVVAPSHGPVHPTGQPWEIITGQPGAVPTITAAERDALFGVVRQMDEMPMDGPPRPGSFPAGGDHRSRQPGPSQDGPGSRPPGAASSQGTPFVPPARPEPPPGYLSPGDDFEERTGWDDPMLLGGAGWTLVKGAPGGYAEWRRPGKQPPGISATTGADRGRDRLYVFSSSTEFETETPYTKLGAYAVLHWGGDHTAAAAELIRLGYGTPRPPAWSAPGPAAQQTGPGGSRPVDILPESDFWTARPALGTILRVARERMVSPWAVFGATLAFVCTRTGPHIQLPPIVGGRASLNVFIGLVGPSGAGKDAALAVAQELLHMDGDDVPTHEVGTGQGIDSVFTSQTKEGPVQFNDSALFVVTEIDTLDAHAGMSGSTVLATLRKVYSGSALGARYADSQKRRPVREHRYRAAVVAGIQPARSKVLLGDADGGTPQRWLWLPTNDPGSATWRPGPFVAPHSTMWTPYEFITAHGDQGEGTALPPPKQRIEMDVCELARKTIVEARRARLTSALVGSDEGLGGHALLTRLKVAALLAILDDARSEVTEEDWRLAGIVMDVSDATREMCQDALNANAQKTNTAKAYAEADRAEIVATAAEKRVAAALLRILRRYPEGRTAGEWRQALSSRDRELFETAVSLLEAAGQLIIEAPAGTATTPRYRCVAQ